MTKGYLGPAAQQFLSGELHALGVNANTVMPSHLEALVARVRENAPRVMGEQRATQLADELSRCRPSSTELKGGHRLASDAAATLLASGKLRQAEKAYVELVKKYADVISYVGLARTQAALEDLTAALDTLREGAARFAKTNDRASAVSLLAEAVALVPADLAAHRRLAAALANQGDMRGAVEEYGRFVDVALTTGDSRRALLELAYGRETLGDLPGVAALVDRVTASHSRSDAPQPARRARPVDVVTAASGTPVARPSMLAPAATPADVPARAADAAAASAPDPAAIEAETAAALRLAAIGSLPVPVASSPAPSDPPPAPVAPPPAKIAPSARPAAPSPTSVAPSPASVAPRRSAPPLATSAPATAAPRAAALPVATRAASTPGPLLARTRPHASDTAVVLKGANTVTHAQQADLEPPMDLLARAGLARPAAAAVPLPPLDVEKQLATLVMGGSGLDAATVAASRAALLASARDPRATDAALDAARRLLALGKLQSASDVLLDYIGRGFTDREAQRLLIEVNCALGRRDVAREKCGLLSQAYRLDGKADVAEDVERLARIL